MNQKQALRTIPALLAGLALTTTSSLAQVLNWDHDANGTPSDGGGGWNGANQWWDGSSSVNWTSASNALIGSGGDGEWTIDLTGGVTVDGSVTFDNYEGEYRLSNDTLTVNGTLTWGPNTTSNGSDKDGVEFQSSASLAGDGTIVVNGNYPAGKSEGQFNIRTSDVSAFTGTWNVTNGVLFTEGAFKPSATSNIILNGGPGANQGAVYSSRWSQTLDRPLGSADNQIQVIGNRSGFEGQGTSGLAVRLDGTGNQAVQWGSADFNPSVLILQSPNSNLNSNVNFDTAVDLNGADRTVDVDVDHGNGIGNSSWNDGRGQMSRAITNSSGTAAGLIKEGPGNLWFAATNTYDGGITVNEGGVRFDRAAALPSTGTHTFNDGIELQVNIGGGDDFTLAAGTAAGSLGGLLAGTGPGTSTVTYSGDVDLTLRGSGTFAGDIPNLGGGGTTTNLWLLEGNTTLSGNNTFSGVLGIGRRGGSGRTLTLGSNTALAGQPSPVVIDSSGTSKLNMNGFNATVGQLQLGSNNGGQGGTVEGAGTLTITGGILVDAHNDGGGRVNCTALDLNGTTQTFTHTGNNRANSDLIIGASIQNGGVTTNATAGQTEIYLNGANTYTGGTTHQAGRLVIDGSLGDASMNITGGDVTGSGTLTFNFDGTASDRIDMSDGTLDLSGFTLNVNATGAGLTEAGYVIIDSVIGGTYAGTFANVTGLSGYQLVYDNNGFGTQVALIDVTGFNFIGGNPADDTPDVLIPSQLQATFNKDLSLGTGNITIKNLTDATSSTLAMTDSRVSLSDNVLLIGVSEGLLEWSKSYSIWIDSGALWSTSGDVFSGIADDSTWNFTTAAGDPLLLAVQDLKDHITGATTLTDTEIAALKATIDANKQRFDSSTWVITSLFDLVATYDAEEGPLFVSGSTVTEFNRNNTNPASVSAVLDSNYHWVVCTIMQYIMDEIYNVSTLNNTLERAVIDGFKFGSVEDFPGAIDPPLSPTTHTATILASFPETAGRDTQGWTEPARKPTGCYLAPGSIVTVQVPALLVDQGIEVRVGAHSWDHEAKNRPPVPRLPRATILYDVADTSFEIASPYGGGIYFEIPKGLELGVADVEITGAVRSPYFSAKSFHNTTASEWDTTERNHLAPWADFQSEKFMMQVSREWIYAMDGADAVQLMADWDAAMDAINSLMGFPLDRGKETMYIQTDLIFRSSVHAPGYPATNVNFNPNGSYNGYQNNYFVRGPQSGAGTEFHEQGHAYFFPKFGGETEANVNLPYVAVRQRAFGMDWDTAFRQSTGNQNNISGNSVDNTAVLWMTSFTFAPRETPMNNWEKAYQPQGHVRWVDFARLFGWQGLDDYWASMNDGSPVPGSDDDKIIRLCEESGIDIRPLFHFWGIIPQDPVAVETAIDGLGLSPSLAIRDQLLFYKTLVPADNAAYQAWCLDWYGREPSIGGFGVEREKTRQFDSTSYWVAGGWQYSGTAATNPDGTPIVDDGEIYTAASATRVEERVQEIIDIYFDEVSGPDDYTVWASQYATTGIDLSDPDADLTGNGWTNNEARLFGLDPTSGSSVSPISVPLDAGTGSFSYTRRDQSLTNATYEIWTSTTLEPGSWVKDTGAGQVPGTPDANGVETVVVTLSATPVGGRLYAQVRAVE